MRLSLPAARPAAHIPSSCANSSFQVSPIPIRPLNLLCKPTRNSIPPNVRQYGASSRLGAGKLRMALLEARRREPEAVDLAALRTLDAEIEKDPTKSLNEHERSMRDVHRRQRFINLMRTVPNPIAIVTTQRQDIEDKKDDFFMGATVSSFKSVCIEPEPYISFNLSKLSRTYKNIVEHKYFCVTIPRNDNAGQRLARAFTYGSPKEALKAGSDGSKIEKHYWNLALEGGNPPDMKYMPPAVKTFNVKGAKTNGLAFAFLCEYHDSIIVGDHVVITGRVLPASIASASPWGKDDDFGDTFAANDMTLGYVHGFYSNPELFGGIDQSWKVDDPYVTKSASESKPPERLEAVGFFEKRLQLIDGVLNFRSGRKVGQDFSESQPHLRARLLPRQRLLEYQKYYQSRVVEYYNVLRMSRGGSESPSENAVDIINTIIQLYPTSDADETEGRVWKTDIVMRKSLLGDEQLEQEEELYLARLEALQWSRKTTRDDLISHLKARPHCPTQMSEQSSENTGSEMMDSSDVSSNSTEYYENADGTGDRREQLIRHFEDKLSLVRQALKARKGALVHPTVPKTSFVPIPVDEQQAWIPRFLGTKRKTPLVNLLSDYREYQVQITETRLARIQCIYQKDQYDVEILQKLEERLTYFEQHLDLIARVIAEKYESLDQAELSQRSPSSRSKLDGNKIDRNDGNGHERDADVTDLQKEERSDKGYFMPVRHFRPQNIGEDEGERAGSR